MTLQFTKMHGLGNDFMVIDGVRQSVSLSKDQIRTWARRDTGIGFDQCLIVERSVSQDIDFFYRIYNANGQEVGQCGNGARCLARFIEYYELSKLKTLRVATKTTRLELILNSDHTVTVNMGKPQFAPQAIPMSVEQQAEHYPLPLANGQIVSVHALSIGNPHAVTVVSQVAETNVAQLGQAISEHPIFPEQCNAGFMSIESPSHLTLRVYERGCGETRACGSGAVAAGAIGRLFYGMNDHIMVKLPGGELAIDWHSTTDPIFLTGEAQFVYEGHLI